MNNPCNEIQLTDIRTTVMFNSLCAEIESDWTLADKATVDGEQWYSIATYHTNIVKWLMEQGPNRVNFARTAGPCHYIDIHETIYTMLLLRWS